MKIYTTVENLSRLAFQGEPSPFVSKTDFSGKCSAPVVLDVRGLPDPTLWALSQDHPRMRDIKRIISRIPKDEDWDQLLFGVPYKDKDPSPVPRSLILELSVPCRKCFHCLRQRSFLWGARAFYETQWSSRTWMLTLTVAPEHRLRAAIMARQKYGDEKFASIAAIVGRWFTLYMKRVRKNANVPLRYLLAVEEHKDGFPHLHALIHERGQEVGKRDLQMQWAYGFTHCKLADSKAARYVTKYVSKQLACRVRASQRYGRSTVQHVHKDIEEGALPEGSLSSTLKIYPPEQT